MDLMLTELYRRYFQATNKLGQMCAEKEPPTDSEFSTTYARYDLLSELITIRTRQIRKEVCND